MATVWPDIFLVFGSDCVLSSLLNRALCGLHFRGAGHRSMWALAVAWSLGVGSRRPCAENTDQDMGLGPGKWLAVPVLAQGLEQGLSPSMNTGPAVWGNAGA